MKKLLFLRRRYKLLMITIVALFICHLVIMPFIYTPPALNRNVLSVYDKWIDLAKKDEHEWTIRLRNLNDAHISIMDETISMREESRSLLCKYFTKESVDNLTQMLHELVDVKCCQITKENNVIYFIVYKKLFPAYVRPGCAYSLDGHELEEEIDAIHPVIKKVRLLHVHGSWYISKDLLLSGMRIDSQYSIPNSIFDKSTKIEWQ